MFEIPSSTLQFVSTAYLNGRLRGGNFGVSFLYMAWARFLRWAFFTSRRMSLTLVWLVGVLLLLLLQKTFFNLAWTFSIFLKYSCSFQYFFGNFITFETFWRHLKFLEFLIFFKDFPKFLKFLNFFEDISNFFEFFNFFKKKKSKFLYFLRFFKFFIFY